MFFFLFKKLKYIVPEYFQARLLVSCHPSQPIYLAVSACALYNAFRQADSGHRLCSSLKASESSSIIFYSVLHDGTEMEEKECETSVFLLLKTMINCVGARKRFLAPFRIVIEVGIYVLLRPLCGM
jgi:hypothetical protein